MGYTHYFTKKSLELDKETFVRFTKDVEKILAKAKEQGIELGDAFGDKENGPFIDEDNVIFNGADLSNEGGEDLSYETFSIKRVDDVNFNFCKTSLLPYDTVVVAVLIALVHHFGNEYEAKTDGKAENIAEGKKLAQSAVGYCEEFEIDEKGFYVVKTPTRNINFSDKLVEILDVYTTGDFDNEPLDGDEVDTLAEIVKLQLNLINGNITNSEYESQIEKLK